MSTDSEGCQLCPLKVKGLTIGFPCKSISSQNCSPQSFSDETSTTGGGFRALLDYCDYDEDLEWVVSENVRNMTHCRKRFSGECPIVLQDKALQQRGFIPVHALVSSCEFGVPQSRTRCWGLYIKASCMKQNAPNPKSLFLNMKCQPLPTIKIFDSCGDMATTTSNKCKRASSGDKWKSVFQEMKAKFGKVWGGKNIQTLGNNHHHKRHYLLPLTTIDDHQNLLFDPSELQIAIHNPLVLSDSRPPQAAVNGNYNALKEKGMAITDRELSILAVATTILQQRGIDPFCQQVVVQVDNTSVVSDVQAGVH